MIAIIDDNQDILASLHYLLVDITQQIDAYTAADDLIAAMCSKRYKLVILDMNLTQGAVDGSEGIALISAIRRLDPQVAIVAITAFADIEIAIDAMRLGANEFIMKPWDNQQLLNRIQALLDHPDNHTTYGLDVEHRFLGNSQATVRVRELLNLAARSDANVLIIGETGTGKEIVAQAIHDLSARRSHNFVAVDSGAIASELFESELFGHEKGAFTGADKRRQGAFLQAHNGSLLLDELGNLPLTMQKKLLRVLEQRQVVAVGADQSRAVDVRVLAATNENLATSIQRGDFRQDLYYRLNTIEIHIPPLRQRPQDIICLAQHFMTSIASQYKQAPVDLTAQDKTLLQNYHWPGNVRELRNVIERYLIHALHGSTSLATVMPQPVTTCDGPQQPTLQSLNLKQLEQQTIQRAINQHQGNLSAAAEALGLSRGALYRRLEKYQHD